MFWEGLALLFFWGGGFFLISLGSGDDKKGQRDYIDKLVLEVVLATTTAMFAQRCQALLDKLADLVFDPTTQEEVAGLITQANKVADDRFNLTELNLLKEAFADLDIQYTEEGEHVVTDAFSYYSGITLTLLSATVAVVMLVVQAL